VPNPTPTAIFVYGTLQPGYPPYEIYCKPHQPQVQRAIVYGQLYQLPIGYPALVVGGDRPVYGYRLSFADPSLLTLLDDYEQHDPAELRQIYPNLDSDRAVQDLAYDRQLIDTFTPDGPPLGSSWVYHMTIAQVTQLQGQFLDQGQWLIPA
jgi:gamma-glutamylcyclotransferase (GGCT)/AIG2-like uncharacterized protein YtfP